MKDSSPTNQFSINALISTFTEIDFEIQELQKYSEKDFKSFNFVMKESHNHLKEISENANKIIKYASISTNLKLINELKFQYSNLKNSFKEYKDNFKQQNHLLSDFVDRIRHLNLPIKNLKQNLFSLKYILANLKLETFNSATESEYSKHINLIEENIIKNTHSIKNFEQNISYLQKLLEKQTLIENSRVLQNFETITNSFDILENAVGLMEKGYQDSETYYPKINDNIDKTKESISNIIVKLQYEDIIRQKMEHMKTVYKKIIDYFGEISEDKNLINNDLLQYYSKIEYIASLQVAQLMQTNKEYEQAIESISEHLLQITLSTNDISYYLKVFTSELPKQEEIFLQWTTKYLNLIKKSNQEILDSESVFNTSNLELNDLINNFQHFFAEIENISETTTSYIKKLSVTEYKNLSKTINLKKLKEVSDYINNILSSIKNNFEKINPEIWSMNVSKIEHIRINPESLRELESKISKITTNEENLEGFLKKSINLAKKISTQVNTSIQEVSYYDYFEKSVEKIIFKLNFLNEKLKFSKSSEISKEELDNLVVFENLYTVKTEKIIHDIVDRGKQSDLDELEVEEDSDVEFF